MADGIEKGTKGLITLGIGVFMLIVFLNLTYQEYSTTGKTIASNYPPNAILTSTISAINQNAILQSASNTITFTCTGSCNWLVGNSTAISISGLAINPPGASNTVYANALGLETQVFTVTNSLAGQTLTSLTGNFYTINSVTITQTSGILNAGLPSFTLSASETTNSVTHGSAPAAYSTNTISGQTLYSLTQSGVAQNFTSYGGGVTNAYGSNLSLAVTALVLIAIVVAILYGIRDTGLVGGFVG